MTNERKLQKPVLVAALITALILMIPLIAMQFTEEVDWGLADFIVMGILVFSVIFCFLLIRSSKAHLAYRVGFTLGLGAAFLMVWANLAVGLIGSGPNLANLMYPGVLVVGITGMFLSNFKPGGMQLTMYGMAIALGVVAIIALLAGVHLRTDSSIIEVLGVNGFFASLFMLSGLMFRYAALKAAGKGPTYG